MLLFATIWGIFVHLQCNLSLANDFSLTAFSKSSVWRVEENKRGSEGDLVSWYKAAVTGGQKPFFFNFRYLGSKL